MMKSVFAFLMLVLACASAFTVIAPARLSGTTTLRMSSEPEQEEEGGLDLDLGEMFQMFEAADKDQDFDKAIKKVKSQGK
mmetsp:Transcript_1967/g.2739  ORF Transcript_1967/g.2739 Transcript_1967/m.2739 type:complete len:80 (+) Transcript_1967:119-358(+)|eukprot:CAMPEP_0198143092 /NCGR_PEP_ID=MMETSP1443-20131203/5752_1 /TAXON_ID=186043 /ORGANISM="Entomoneis sp., Strain CCMP2396" /LENGTH=79 /DNA_ID=CAMNT_0043806233 /DNA_START=88 /DNA_END=327 /DNA_ORIENTATION=+